MGKRTRKGGRGGAGGRRGTGGEARGIIVMVRQVSVTSAAAVRDGSGPSHPV